MRCSAFGCDRAARGRGDLCNLHRQRLRRRGDPSVGLPSALERFVTRVQLTASCWMWTGSGSGRDYAYGQFWADGENVLAHRFAYQAYVGPIPEGLEIDHTCRVQKCVNPMHLEPVTAAENIRRMRAAQAIGAQ